LAFYWGIPFEITKGISVLRLSLANVKGAIYRGVLFWSSTVIPSDTSMYHPRNLCVLAGQALT
jgi:hypothetical protein